MNNNKCMFLEDFNIFGIDDKPCWYLYHKYCSEINACYYKQLQKLKKENERLKEVLNGNI